MSPGWWTVVSVGTLVVLVMVGWLTWWAMSSRRLYKDVDPLDRPPTWWQALVRRLRWTRREFTARSDVSAVPPEPVREVAEGAVRRLCAQGRAPVRVSEVAKESGLDLVTAKLAVEYLERHGALRRDSSGALVVVKHKRR